MTIGILKLRFTASVFIYIIRKKVLASGCPDRTLVPALAAGIGGGHPSRYLHFPASHATPLVATPHASWLSAHPSMPVAPLSCVPCARWEFLHPCHHSSPLPAYTAVQHSIPSPPARMHGRQQLQAAVAGMSYCNMYNTRSTFVTFT
jgi:hypothetical protein